MHHGNWANINLALFPLSTAPALLLLTATESANLLESNVAFRQKQTCSYSSACIASERFTTSVRLTLLRRWSVWWLMCKQQVALFHLTFKMNIYQLIHDRTSNLPSSRLFVPLQKVPKTSVELHSQIACSIVKCSIQLIQANPSLRQPICSRLH